MSYAFRKLKITNSILDVSKLLSANVITKFIGMCVLMIYARMLSKEELSGFTIYRMLSGFVTLLLSFGIFPTMIKLLPSLLKEDKKKAQEFIKSCFTLIVGGTIIVSIIILFLSHQLSYLLTKGLLPYQLLKCMTLGFVALSICRLTDYILWASGRYTQKTLLSIIDSIIRPAITISFYFLFRINGLVYGLVLSQVISAIFSVYFVKDVICFQNTRFYSLKRLIRESFPFYLESYLMYFRKEGDSWLVTSMLGPSVLSIYYIAKTFYEMFLMFFTSVDKVITERLSKNVSDIMLFKIKIQKLYDTLSKLIGLIFFIISLLPIIIPLIFGGKYISAVSSAIILLIAVSVQFLRIPIARSIFLISRSIDRFKLTLIDTIILFITLPILGPIFGILGVALSRLISQIAGFLWGIYFLNNRLFINLSHNSLLKLLSSVFPVTIVVIFMIYSFQAKFNEFILLSVASFLWFVLFLILTFLFNRVLLGVHQLNNIKLK